MSFQNPDTSKEIVRFVHEVHPVFAVTLSTLSSETGPDTAKDIVQFVDEVRPVFAVTLSTLSHMLCGWNDDTIPSFNIFTVHFVVIFNFTVI